MRERDIEEHLKEKIEKLGGLCMKWSSPGCTGVPDRIVFLPGGRVYFVELKRESGRVRARQKVMIEKLMSLGCRAVVLSSLEEVEQFVQEVSREEL